MIASLDDYKTPKFFGSTYLQDLPIANKMKEIEILLPPWLYTKQRALECSRPIKRIKMKIRNVIGTTAIVLAGILICSNSPLAKGKANTGVAKAIAAKLKAAVANGKMTKEQAMAKYKAMTKKAIAAKKEGLGNKAKAKTGTAKAAAAKLKAAVANGKITKEQAMAKYKAMTRKAIAAKKKNLRKKGKAKKG